MVVDQDEPADRDGCGLVHRTRDLQLHGAHQAGGVFHHQGQFQCGLAVQAADACVEVGVQDPQLLEHSREFPPRSARRQGQVSGVQERQCHT